MNRDHVLSDETTGLPGDPYNNGASPAEYYTSRECRGDIHQQAIEVPDDWTDDDRTMER
jgi:hypothetical protein